MEQTEATVLAIKLAGGRSALADRFGVTRQAVQDWAKRGRIPPDKVLTVEKLSGISRYLLRPDVFGADPGHPPKPTAYLGGPVSQVA